MDFKDRSTESLIHELHRRGPMTPPGQWPKSLLDLRQRLIDEAAPEARDAERARLDAIMAEDKHNVLASVQDSWDYTEALRAELARRPHIMRPYQKRAQRRARAKANRGLGKSKNR